MGCEQLIVSSEETYPEALGILGDLVAVDKQLIMKCPWEELEPLPICAHTFERLSSQHFFTLNFPHYWHRTPNHL